MKIGKLDMHCGDCHLIDYCGEPFEFAICNSFGLKQMDADEYIKLYKSYQEKISNKEDIFEYINEHFKTEKNATDIIESLF